MKIKLIFTGQTRESFVKDGLEHYLQKLKHYVKIERREIEDIKSLGSLEPQQVKRLESEKQLSALEKDDVLVLLDERGLDISSKEFANFLDKQAVHSVKALAFMIGGPYGFDDSVRLRAQHILRLSKMTFPHQMVRIILAEQLYRGYSILHHQPYHHE